MSNNNDNGTIAVKQRVCVRGFVFFTDRIGQKWVVLLLKQRPENIRGRWMGIGGKVDPGETPVQAMVREFQEEAGAFIPADRWREFCTMNTPEWRVHAFVADVTYEFYSEHMKAITDEAIAHWRVNILPNRMTEETAWMIPMAMDQQVGYAIADSGAQAR